MKSVARCAAVAASAAVASAASGQAVTALPVVLEAGPAGDVVQELDLFNEVIPNISAIELDAAGISLGQNSEPVLDCSGTTVFVDSPCFDEWYGANPGVHVAITRALNPADSASQSGEAAFGPDFPGMPRQTFHGTTGGFFPKQCDLTDAALTTKRELLTACGPTAAQVCRPSVLALIDERRSAAFGARIRMDEVAPGLVAQPPGRVHAFETAEGSGGDRAEAAVTGSAAPAAAGRVLAGVMLADLRVR